jgi:hypothetical protein
MDAVTRDARKLLGTDGWKRLALDLKNLGREKIEEARAHEWAVMPQQQQQQQQQ